MVDLEVHRRDTVERFSVTLAEGSDVMPHHRLLEFRGDVHGELQDGEALHRHEREDSN